MRERGSKLPDQEELERELSEYLSKKYGQPIKVISPMMMPRSAKDATKSGDSTGIDRVKFDMKPEELEDYLNRYVIKQGFPKSVLATKICTHYHRIRWQRRKGIKNSAVGRIKNNIILMGPTGVGKTYLVKLIAQKLNVPFVKGDATKFSETGYVGGDVEDLVRDLVAQADEDIELAQCGIIYIDEIDKIAATSNLIGPDVSRTGVQRALLKPLEETEVDLKVAHDPISQLQAIEYYRKTGKREKQTINTRDILFIVSGAFTGLADIVRRRLQKQGIGFGASLHNKAETHELLKQVKAEDLIAYGFESEFIGRLPVIAVLDPLEVEDLYQILKNPNNPIIQSKKEDFRCYGIDIKFEDEALRRFAELAYGEKTGARGLVSVIERVLLPFEKSLPSTEIDYLVVGSDLVTDPQGTIDKILARPRDPKRRRRYEAIVNRERRETKELITERKKHYLENYPLVFNARRLELLADRHLHTGQPVDDLFDEMVVLYNQVRVFEDAFYERHGFRLHFQEEAIDAIIEAALQREMTASALCREIAKDYDYGFRLVAERSGQTRFLLPKKAVLQPDEYLDWLIRDTYRRYPLDSMDMNSEEKKPESRKRY